MKNDGGSFQAAIKAFAMNRLLELSPHHVHCREPATRPLSTSSTMGRRQSVLTNQWAMPQSAAHASAPASPPHNAHSLPRLFLGIASREL
jgi:hypothetical protein